VTGLQYPSCEGGYGIDGSQSSMMIYRPRAET
jgi:hypothetical protein